MTLHYRFSIQFILDFNNNKLLGKKIIKNMSNIIAIFYDNSEINML